MAISITTLSIAALTFSLGYKTGLSQAPPTPQIEEPPLLPDADQQDTLEELLRQIESAHEKKKSNDFLFPNEIEAPKLPVPEPKKTQTSEHSTVVPSKDQQPEDPRLASINVPQAGWSVQIASFPSEQEAKDKVKSLIKKDLTAYFVKAPINNDTWYRVRIGGYDSKSDAIKGKAELEALLKGSGYLVQKAP